MQDARDMQGHRTFNAMCTFCPSAMCTFNAMCTFCPSAMERSFIGFTGPRDSSPPASCCCCCCCCNRAQRDRVDRMVNKQRKKEHQESTCGKSQGESENGVRRNDGLSSTIREFREGRSNRSRPATASVPAPSASAAAATPTVATATQRAKARQPTAPSAPLAVWQPDNEKITQT